MALTLTAVLVTASLAVAPPVWAKAEKTPFSGTIYYVTTIDEGEDRFADGNIIGRGIIMLYDDQMSDYRISGQETVVVNYNMRMVEDPVVMITGPMWGTSQIVNEFGYWDVVWTGKRDKRGWGYLRCVAHGHGE